MTSSELLGFDSSPFLGVWQWAGLGLQELMVLSRAGWEDAWDREQGPYPLQGHLLKAPPQWAEVKQGTQ